MKSLSLWCSCPYFCRDIVRRQRSVVARQSVQRVLWGIALAVAICLAMASGLQAQPVSPTPPRQPTDRDYSFKDFSGWLLQTIPQLDSRPAHFIFVMDRTDSVNAGTVLPILWRRDLLGMMLQEFLVEGLARQDKQGHTIYVDGDSISLSWHGQRRTEKSLWQQSFVYRDRTSKIENRFQDLMPFHDTPMNLQGTYLNQAAQTVADWVKNDGQTQNTVILLVTDDAQEGRDSQPPPDLQGFQKDSVIYRGKGDNDNTRQFRVYAYWNSFPNDSAFTHYDTRLHQVRPESRTARAVTQHVNNGLPLSTSGTTRYPPPASLPNPAQALWTAIAIIGGLALLFLLWRDWYGAYYSVTINGVPDNTIWVFPGRWPRIAKLPNPNFPQDAGEMLGTLKVSGPGILRLHRLTLEPTSGYSLSLKGRGRESSDTQAADAAPTGRSGRRRKPTTSDDADASRSTGRPVAPLTLAAGRRGEIDNEIAFAPANDKASDREQRTGLVTLPVRQQQGLGGKQQKGSKPRRRAPRRSQSAS